MTRNSATRLFPRVLAVCLALMLGAACDELGPDAHGERQVTALQSIERDRQCIPLQDMRQIRWGEARRIEVLLQDGSRWLNTPVANGACPAPSSDAAFAAPTAAKELCSGDTLTVMSRSPQVLRVDGACQLSRFQRL